MTGSISTLVRLSAAVATSALVVGSAAGTSASAAGGSSAPTVVAQATVSIDLEGDTWAFSLGDDPAWSNPAFDDSAWERTSVPSDGAAFANYDGFGWYRLTFDLPADAEGANLVASLGFIDDVDEAFLNGQLIGGSGSMPPNASSQWFEKRLYPVPADAPVFGGSNVLAVRVFDMSGGGGWYSGPIGIFSKDAVRETVYGITADPATTEQSDAVRSVLDQQADALSAGDADAYLATLDQSYFHDGRDFDRRAREVRQWLGEAGSLQLTDSEVEVVVTDDGTLIADTNRRVVGTVRGSEVEYQAAAQEFLRFDPASLLETGNHSRFFRETLSSDLEGADREFVTYLPPSYLEQPHRHYPVVYLLHGVNGGSREWEPREMDEILDGLWADGLAETIVIMPDGESLWYNDASGVPWRSMFLQEMLPLVDQEYRTLAQPEFRALSGVSMGAYGAYSIGLSNPDLFASLASHIGSLGFTPFGDTPITQARAMTAEQLEHFTFYFDACEFDDFRFDNAVRQLAEILDEKGVPHTSEVYPEGRHNDACWLPKVDRSFRSHSESFRAAGLQEDRVAFVTGDAAGLPKPDATTMGVLTDVGYDVVLVDDDDISDSAALESADVVVISSSVLPAKIPAELAMSELPILNLEGFVSDDLGLAVRSGEQPTNKNFVIMNPETVGHPLAAGLVGYQGVYRTPQPKHNFGVVGGDAIVLATTGGSPRLPTYYAYENGTELANGEIAPARRVAHFPTYPGPEAFTGKARALLLASVEWLVEPPANMALLNDGGATTLSPTSTQVSRDRFDPDGESFATAITDVKFTVQRLRTDLAASTTIGQPLEMERNGVKWDEYNMLVSATGFSGEPYPIGRAEGEGRDLNVRVMIPAEGWNQRLVFWHHGSADTQVLAFTPVVETELLLSRGYAVASAQFNGVVPEQQNPHASDDSYWKAVDEMYTSDEARYWSYGAHPDWFSNRGRAIGDGATLRNLTGLVKNLITHATEHAPSHSYWLGWSAGGAAGTAVNTGRDSDGNYIGGGFVVPFDKSSGKVFDGFMALEPVFRRTAPVDEEFPVTAPYFFVDGAMSPFGLTAPNALNFANKVNAALDGPDADPSLSKDIDDWERLYMQRYGNHDWMGRFYETVYSGDDEASGDAVWYDRSEPVLADRFNTDGVGRQLSWVMSNMYRSSPEYLLDWADENKPGWGQLTETYYQLNDGYHTALLDHLVAWAEHGTAPPTSRIDPHLMDPAATTYPDLPVDDPTQDSLERPLSEFGDNAADIEWQRTSPDALTVVPTMVEMPHVTARWGIFELGYKILRITPFTPEQLVDGYHVGNIDFDGYADPTAYDEAFADAVTALEDAGFYDHQIADTLAGGDPGLPSLPFPTSPPP